MEVGPPTDIAVAQGFGIGLWIEEGAIQAGLEDRADRRDRPGLDDIAALTGRLQTRLAVDLLQGQDIPRQVRKPCSGWGRSVMMAWVRAAVAGPIFSATAVIRAGVQEACRR